MYAVGLVEEGVTEPRRIIAVDTETERNRVWSVQWAMEPRRARMWLADSRRPLPVHEVLEDPDTLTVFHNALFDLKALHDIGVRPARYTDTMIMAYLLGMDAIGLKTLAYRYANMVLREYGEMVRPATEAKAAAYLDRVIGRTWPDPEPVIETRPDGSLHVKWPQNLTKRLTAYLKKVAKGTAVQTPYEYWTHKDREADRDMVEGVFGELEPGYLSDIPLPDAVRYGCMDADATLRIYAPLSRYIMEHELEGTLERDLGCVEMVVDMMRNGIPLDRAWFSQLDTKFSAHAEDVLKRVEQLAGRYVNPGSSKQVAVLLHDLGYPVNSTAADELDGLRDVPVVAAIQEHRQTTKLLGTYVRKMPRMADEEGRLHTDLSMTRTETGRLASSKPNLQNVAVRTEEGRQIRKGFVAGDGNVLISGDLSQVEMRLAAHLSQDAYMLEIFRTGQDIHTMTASRAYGIPPEKVDPKRQRYPMKRTGFGVLYGITAEGLLDVFLHEGVTGYTVDQCQKFIDDWFDTFPGVKVWESDVEAEARRYGRVRDMFGRIRYVPEVYSALSWVREAGIRQAVNAPIQMSAQGIIKEAMRQLTPVYREWQAAGFVFRPLLQIHDELLWEVQEDMVDTVVPIMHAVMVNAVELSVPMGVDFEVGRNWLEQKEWKEGAA